MAGRTAVAEPESVGSPAPAKDAEELDDELITKTVTIRGTDYLLRELSQEEYDACVQMATGKDGFDNILLLKFMLSKSLVKPKLTAEDLKRKPFKVTNELRMHVNRMHWGDDEVVEDDEGNESSTPEI